MPVSCTHRHPRMDMWVWTSSFGSGYHDCLYVLNQLHLIFFFAVSHKTDLHANPPWKAGIGLWTDRVVGWCDGAGWSAV